MTLALNDRDFQRRLLFAFLLFAAAVLLRSQWIFIKTWDITRLVLPWYAAIAKNGLTAAYSSTDITVNYHPPYIYLLAIGQWLLPQAAPMIVIKGINFLTDGVAAFFVWRIIRFMCPQKPEWYAWAAAAALLFLPTVVLNGAVWGQCDMLPVVCCLAVCYYGLKGRMVAAGISMGLAIAMKPQALVLLPFFALLLARHSRAWWAALLVPGVYVASWIPLWLAGYSLMDGLSLLGRRIWKIQQTEPLSTNAGSVFALLRFPGYPNNLVRHYTYAVLMVILFLYLWVGVSRRRQLTPTAWLVVAALPAITFPFFMPSMHDRYFFTFDVLSLVLAFADPRFVAVAIAAQIASLLQYSEYLGFFLPIKEHVKGPFVAAAVINIWMMVTLWLHYVDKKDRV